jgi:hypothetical protein
MDESSGAGRLQGIRHDEALLLTRKYASKDVGRRCVAREISGRCAIFRSSL